MPCLRELKKPPQVRKSILQLSLAQGPMPTGVQQLLPEDLQRQIRFHGGAHVNHTLFWRFLRPRGQGAYGPLNGVAKVICDQFGTVQSFKEAFASVALNHFGSGWAWLVYRPDGKLVITTTRGEDNPLMKDYVNWQDEGMPILALDLWEHAYYLKIQTESTCLHRRLVACGELGFRGKGAPSRQPLTVFCLMGQKVTNLDPPFQVY